MGEGDDIIDAGRKQHQQHPQPHHRIGGKELEKNSHEQRPHDEIHDEQGREKADLCEGSPKIGKGHLQEGEE